MRQFDVFRNPSQQSRAAIPYVAVLQSHYLDAIATVVIAPLISVENVRPDDLITLPVDVNGEPFTLAVALLVNIEARRLTSSVGNISQYEDAIRRALERVFTGF
jgi:toxin CcdB